DQPAARALPAAHGGIGGRRRGPGPPGRRGQPAGQEARGRGARADPRAFLTPPGTGPRAGVIVMAAPAMTLGTHEESDPPARRHKCPGTGPGRGRRPPGGKLGGLHLLERRSVSLIWPAGYGGGMAETQREPVPRVDSGELDTALAFLS